MTALSCPLTVGMRVGTTRGDGTIVDIIPAATVERMQRRSRTARRWPALITVELDQGGRTLCVYSELLVPEELREP